MILPLRLNPLPAPDPMPSLMTEVMIGMPHLALTGLSEKRLLEELGHLHWMLLARAAGRKDPHFRTERGEPVYAAFCALAIRDAAFHTVRENDVLTIISQTARITRTQVASLHKLFVAGRPVGEIELLSTFIHRKGSSNQSVARFEIAGLPPCTQSPLGRTLAEAAARHRAKRATIEPNEGRPVLTFNPCPSTDFNGAGFLYFPSFLAFVDRAEWANDPTIARDASTRERTVFFTGNLDPGEAIVLAFTDWQVEAATGDLVHRCVLARGDLRQPIAEVISRRRSRLSDTIMVP